jgi:hypothetical protein
VRRARGRRARGRRPNRWAASAQETYGWQQAITLQVGGRLRRDIKRKKELKENEILMKRNRDMTKEKYVYFVKQERYKGKEIIWKKYKEDEIYKWEIKEYTCKIYMRGFMEEGYEIN